MNLRSTLAFCILVFCACADSRASPRPIDADALRADVVVAWNRRLLALAVAEDQLLTLKGARTLSMMHLAVHDALNAIHPKYAAYAYTARAPDADPIAAAARAAHDLVAHEYPAATRELGAELAAWLDPIPAGPRKSAGLVVGADAAAEILRLRQGDGWNAEGEYRTRPAAPGVYAAFPEHSGTPPEFVFGGAWGRARPFLLLRADQFRPPPPPSIDSPAYAAAFDEVSRLGRFDSIVRTAEQTHTALWWKDFAESSMNRLGAELAAQKELKLWRAARLFALVNASIFDGYVSSFEGKFFYNHWRPYTAIRAAAADGNPSTTADPEWDNTHHHTYPFPTYPSAHATVCAAALRHFADAFGDAQPFDMTTPEVHEAGPLSPLRPMEPATRSFATFSAAASECAASRVYLGIHFRYDSDAGNQLGTDLAEYAASQFLAPMSPM
jgi:hypothetical protein